MKVLVDALAVENHKTGVTQYALRLLRELLPLDRSVAYIILVQPGLDPHHELFHIVAENPNATSVSKNIPAIGILRDLKFLGLRNLLGCDLYHCLNSNLPLSMGSRSIVTIHDLKYLLYPRYLGCLRSLKSAYLRRVFGHAARRASRLITVSDSTREDLLRLFGARSADLSTRARTVYEASCLEKRDSPVDLEKDGVRQPYFLYVGELRPHKNVNGLIAGFDRFVAMQGVGKEIRLVIVGKRHRSFSLPTGFSEQVVFAGYVPDSGLYGLYQNALGYCLVSSYEGFGLPVLEAMEAGTPVITSNVSSTREVAADAALLVDPSDVDAIAQAMYRLYTDAAFRQQLVAKGRQRAARFSWRLAAEKTLDIYREMMKSS